MRNTEERERHFQKVINRWENDGGAVAKNEFPRRRVFDDHNAGENPAFIPGNAERKQTPGRFEQGPKSRIAGTVGMRCERE